jgi:acyl-CoA synthetase (NDP forming)
MTSTGDAVRAMLGARSIAVVGASARPGSFGDRVVTEVRRSPGSPTVHLVNPRWSEVQGLPCVPSLTDVAEPVDLVLLAVGDGSLEDQLRLAADRGDRSAVVFGSAWAPSGEGPSLRRRIADLARGSGMALCGGGCMGFVDLTSGVRALGYLERPDLPRGPAALVSHSGSAFSALLRTRRRIGWTSAVSSGQELVTTTADYVEHALDDPGTRAIALVLETVREPARLRTALDRATRQDVPVALLAVGGSASAELVTAHSGALAGADATWEALTEAHGLLRVHDLDELANLLELLTAGRRVTRHGPGTGIGSVHDSGAERVLVADIAHREGVPFAELTVATTARLAGLLDPGLEVGNPLDVWGTGHGTRALFAGCLSAMAGDPRVAAVALAVDLVEEYDGDESYPRAALDAAAATHTPVVVLSHVTSAVDQAWAGRLREAGVPVLEGTRSGLRALGHLLALGEPRPEATGHTVDPARQARWRDRLAAGPLDTVGSFALLRDYGIATVDARQVSTVAAAVAAAASLTGPAVLKTDEGLAHKSDDGGVRLALVGADAVAAAYDDLARRFGPAVLVCSTAPAGVELSVGLADDPLLGPLVVAGAGGVLVELLADRVVLLPPVDGHRAGAAVDRLRVRPLLDGLRGGPAAQLPSVHEAVVGLGALAVELGDVVRELDVNPLVAGPGGAVAADVLVVPR